MVGWTIHSLETVAAPFVDPRRVFVGVGFRRWHRCAFLEQRFPFALEIDERGDIGFPRLDIERIAVFHHIVFIEIFVGETAIRSVDRVEQVLLNLLSNAAKFTSSGSIRLQHSVDRTAKTISFIVEDTGIGIPRGKEEFIFERFEKLDYSSPGYGLGLYICRLMANILGGVIYLDPSYRHGARFIFTIPISPRKKDDEKETDKPLPETDEPDFEI